MNGTNIGSWDGSEWEILMDEVKQRVAELSVESGKHMSKKAKKEQRATFRDFMSTIVEDEAPCEIVAFRGGQLTLKNWKEIIWRIFATKAKSKMGGSRNHCNLRTLR